VDLPEISSFRYGRGGADERQQPFRSSLPDVCRTGAVFRGSIRIIYIFGTDGAHLSSLGVEFREEVDPSGARPSAIARQSEGDVTNQHPLISAHDKITNWV